MKKAFDKIRVRGQVLPDGNAVFVDGIKLELRRSLSVRNHSPSGFNWGYCGSGPAQTALAICLHVFEDEAFAKSIYQEFKSKIVAAWPKDEDFEVVVDIKGFLLDIGKLV